jgi:hypothetical protein
MSDSGIRAIDDLAARRGVKRSDMVRVLLAYAVRNMPEGWKP